MQASHTFKTRFFEFSKGCALISSGATRNRKENLKRHILMYSIGGWTGEGNIVLPAHSITVNSWRAVAARRSEFKHHVLWFLSR